MGKVTKKEMPMWAKTGHKRPVTRREFLAHGLIPFAASALVPGALGLLTAPLKAMAEGEACAAAGSGLPAFVSLHLAGGAAMTANFMPTDAGGGNLMSYSKLGLGSGGNIPARANEFGVMAFSSRSRMLAGIQDRAAAATLANTSFAAICVQSRDDSAENKFDVTGLAFKAGVVGARLPNLGTQSTPTGLTTQPALLSPPPPLVVDRFADVANSIGFTNALKNSLNQAQQSRLAKLVSNLTTSQTRRLASISTTAGVKSVIDCAGIKNVELIQQGANAVNPLTSPQAAAISALYGITGNTPPNNQAGVFSTMVYNGLNGSAGTINLQIGGYDYHDNTRTSGDNKDFEAGQEIGRVLQMASILNVPVFIYVTTDGAVAGAESATPDGAWVSDRGSASSMLMFMYRPSGRPAMNGFQIGHFNANQEAEQSTLVGNNAELAAQAVFANYCKFAQPDNFDLMFRRVIPRGGSLDGDNLKSVLKVA